MSQRKNILLIFNHGYILNIDWIYDFFLFWLAFMWKRTELLDCYHVMSHMAPCPFTVGGGEGGGEEAFGWYRRLKKSRVVPDWKFTIDGKKREVYIMDGLSASIPLDFWRTKIQSFRIFFISNSKWCFSKFLHSWIKFLKKICLQVLLRFRRKITWNSALHTYKSYIHWKQSMHKFVIQTYNID